MATDTTELDNRAAAARGELNDLDAQYLDLAKQGDAASEAKMVTLRARRTELQEQLAVLEDQRAAARKQASLERIAMLRQGVVDVGPLLDAWPPMAERIDLALAELAAAVAAGMKHERRIREQFTGHSQHVEVRDLFEALSGRTRAALGASFARLLHEPFLGPALRDAAPQLAAVDAPQPAAAIAGAMTVEAHELVGRALAAMDAWAADIEAGK